MTIETDFAKALGERALRDWIIEMVDKALASDNLSCNLEQGMRELPPEPGDKSIWRETTGEMTLTLKWNDLTWDPVTTRTQTRAWRARRGLPPVKDEKVPEPSQSLPQGHAEYPTYAPEWADQHHEEHHSRELP